jgi:hypothetical protein
VADPNSGGGFAFLSYVSAKTGLAPNVIRAWMLAEGGPSDNPLNIGPGRHYGSPQHAASATVSLLHNSRYAGILRAAHRGSEKDQLAAIAASPWDAGHYSGGTGKPGTLLAGTYARVTHGKGGGGGGVIGGVAGAIGGAEHAVAAPFEAVADVPGAIGGAVSSAEHFVVKESVVAASYVTLLMVAIALFVLGAMRATGTSPADAAMLAATKGKAGKGGGIPF